MWLFLIRRMSMVVQEQRPYPQRTQILRLIGPKVPKGVRLLLEPVPQVLLGVLKNEDGMGVAG